MWFRAFPMGTLGSFLFDVWLCVEPVWDFTQFNPDRTYTYPKRSEMYDADWSSRQLRPASGHWGWQSTGERDQLGHEMRALLTSDVIPRFARALDRGALLRMARGSDESLLDFPGWEWHRASVYQALLVDAGPSHELDEVLLRVDQRVPKEARFLNWAAARLLDGPTWRTITDANIDTPAVDL